MPIIELPVPLTTEMDETIGSYIADLIEDGSTLQIGIGGIPNAVCKFLEHKKDLGIHTELITDYLMGFVESGALNGSKKSIHKGKIVATIVEGTRKLFDFVDNNSCIELHPVDYTNNPSIIAQNNKMVSINATIEIDLFGQCCSESIGCNVWGGSGGQSDFARGVTMSPNGKGFIVLKSTAKGGTISKIVPTLTPGASVTTGRNYVDHVVTEYGVVKLRGLSYLAVQGCEHINRSLVVEEECQDFYRLEAVTVLPDLYAGGAMSLKAWRSFERPVMIEQIAGHAGIDVGDTFIGMHLSSVAVPIRLEIKEIGGAHLTMARTRPRMVGGRIRLVIQCFGLLVERSIRPFTIGRKNWVTMKTDRGARDSSMVYSIILTALANDLKVYDYLVYLLKQMPNTNFNEHPELIEKFVPWSKELPANCYKAKK